MPVQVSDSLTEILDAQASPSIAQSFGNAVGTTSYLRPLRIAQIKALFDLARRAHYRLVYRGFHALLIVALIWLFVRALPIESPLDAAAAAVALTVLTGMHTFLGFLREAFPDQSLPRDRGVRAGRAEPHALARRLADRPAGRAHVRRRGADARVGRADLGRDRHRVDRRAARRVHARAGRSSPRCSPGTSPLRFWYLDTGLPSLTERTSGFFLERLEPVGAPAAVRRSRVSCSTPTTSSRRCCRCCSPSRATVCSSRRARGAAATFTRTPI